MQTFRLLGVPLLVAVLLLPATSRSQNQDGDARFQKMQQTKLRVVLARREVLKRHGSPLEIFKIVYEPVADGNARQLPQNRRIAETCLEHAALAEKARKPKKQKMYLTLAGIYKYYAQQNAKIVKAYKDLDSGGLKAALAEIEKIEKKIVAMGLKPANRDWFMPQELQKIPLPGQESSQSSGSAPKAN